MIFWILFVNLGIFVYLEFEYSIVKVNDEKYIIVFELFEIVVKMLEWENVEVVKIVKGSEFEYIVVKYLFYDCDLLVMLGDYVIIDVGIGCVYIVLGYGEDDFVVGKKYGLEVFCLVDDKGVLINEVFGFEGLFYDKVNKLIIEKLEEVGVLLKLIFIIYLYLYDWRMKKLIIFCVIV